MYKELLFTDKCRDDKLFLRYILISTKYNWSIFSIWPADHQSDQWYRQAGQLRKSFTHNVLLLLEQMVERKKMFNSLVGVKKSRYLSGKDFSSKSMLTHLSNHWFAACNWCLRLRGLQRKHWLNLRKHCQDEIRGWMTWNCNESSNFKMSDFHCRWLSDRGTESCWDQELLGSSNCLLFSN